MRHAQDWDSATFQMGHRYSKAFLSSTLAKEKQDAKSRVNKHWLEVQRKQELARKLRNELQSLQRDLERAEEGLSDACRRYNLAKELPILLNAWIPNNVSFPLFWLIKTTSRNMLPGSPFAMAAGTISPGELPN